MVRTVVAVVAAIVVTIVGIFAFEALTGLFFAPPEAAATGDKEALRAAIAGMPFIAKLMIVLGWALGAAAGAVAGVVIGRKPWIAWVAGGFAVVGVVLNSMGLPQPMWMLVGGVVGPLVAAAVIQRVLPVAAPAPA